MQILNTIYKQISKLYFIFFVAFLARFVAIGQSLWLDEAISAMTTKMSFWTILKDFSPFDFHPPLYYLVLRVWSILMGNSEVSLRLLSVIASLAAGYLIYRTGNLLKGGWGKWSALFFLFNPLVLYYSQEARMYMLNIFFLSGVTYYWVILFKELYSHPKKSLTSLGEIESALLGKSNIMHLSLDNLQKNPKGTLIHYFKGEKTGYIHPTSHPLFMFNLFAALSVVTFYGSWFYLAGLFVITLSRFSFRQAVWLLVGPLIALLFGLPLLISQFQSSVHMRTLVPNWYKVLGVANIRNTLLIAIKLTSGRISFEPKILYLSLSFVWFLIISFSLLSNWRKNQLWLGLIISIFIWGFLFSLITPLLTYFRFLYLVIPLSLALAEEKHRSLKLFILGGFMICGCLYLFSPTQHREDWKTLSQDLFTNSSLVMVSSAADPIRYYRPDVKIIDLKSIDKNTVLPDKFVMSPYVTDIHGIDYVRNFTSKGYNFQFKKGYHMLTLETWSKENSKLNEWNK